MKANLFEISLKRLEGQPATLSAYRGKVLLIVNVASKCGLTPQYAGLERLYQARHTQGLEILGFPANNFMGQEPGTEAEIASFCATNYDVHFPLFGKISVGGADRHPLYEYLTDARREAVGDGPMREKLAGYGVKPGAPGDILWNFEKFLIARDGSVAGRFAPDVAPDDVRLTTAIDSELAKAA
jgi:glutathione peroxidase